MSSVESPYDLVRYSWLVEDEPFPELVDLLVLLVVIVWGELFRDLQFFDTFSQFSSRRNCHLVSVGSEDK